MGVPGAWSSEALAQALRNLGAESSVVPLRECVHDLSSGKVHWRGKDLGMVQGVLVKKIGDFVNQHVENRIVVLRELGRAGVCVASTPDALDATVNRYRMTWQLIRAGIPVPRTMVTESFYEAAAVVETWGRVVLKPLFTTKARGMSLLTKEADYSAALHQFQQEGRGPFYLQEFVEARGRDVGVAVLGGDFLAAYSRVAVPGQWKTTTEAGGHYEPIELSHEALDLAMRAARLFNLDFTGVDLVETKNGWMVYEVSAFGSFSGLRDAYNMDAPALYARYFLEKVRRGRT
jgi:ribosomal protein S6--L-glutamate ligase